MDVDPVPGSEANKRRPVVIASNDRANAYGAIGSRGITVVPVTSNTTSVYPFPASLLTGRGLAVDSKARAEQITSVAVQRLLKRVGRCSPADLAALDDAVRLHLDL